MSEKHSYIEIETLKQWKQIVKDSNENNTKIIVDFYADWCGPCKRIAPLFAKASDSFPNVKFYKMNADNEELKDVMDKLEIEGLPTFLVAEGDDVIDQLVGGDPHKFTDLIEKHCLSNGSNNDEEEESE